MHLFLSCTCYASFVSAVTSFLHAHSFFACCRLVTQTVLLLFFMRSSVSSKEAARPQVVQTILSTLWRSQQKRFSSPFVLLYRCRFCVAFVNFWCGEAQLSRFDLYLTDPFHRIEQNFALSFSQITCNARGRLSLDAGASAYFARDKFCRNTVLKRFHNIMFFFADTFLTALVKRRPWFLCHVAIHFLPAAVF